MNMRHLYEVLEQEALSLDDVDDELAENIRGTMDIVWFKRLSPDDKRYLNSRGTVDATGQGFVEVETSLYVQVDEWVPLQNRPPVVDSDFSQLLMAN